MLIFSAKQIDAIRKLRRLERSHYLNVCISILLQHRYKFRKPVRVENAAAQSGSFAYASLLLSLPRKSRVSTNFLFSPPLQINKI